jgi:hypothetical protein
MGTDLLTPSVSLLLKHYVGNRSPPRSRRLNRLSEFARARTRRRPSDTIRYAEAGAGSPQFKCITRYRFKTPHSAYTLAASRLWGL